MKTESANSTNAPSNAEGTSGKKAVIKLTKKQATTKYESMVKNSRSRLKWMTQLMAGGTSTKLGGLKEDMAKVYCTLSEDCLDPSKFSDQYGEKYIWEMNITHQIAKLSATQPTESICDILQRLLNEAQALRDGEIPEWCSLKLKIKQTTSSGVPKVSQCRHPTMRVVRDNIEQTQSHLVVALQIFPAVGQFHPSGSITRRQERNHGLC